jgi:hypothetical protein
MKILDRFFNQQKKVARGAELGRNQVCWCGSGKKYKRCHLHSDENKKRMKGGLSRKG